MKNFFLFLHLDIFYFCPASRYLKKKADLKRMKKKQRKCGRGKESMKKSGKKLERIGYSLHLISFIHWMYFPITADISKFLITPILFLRFFLKNLVLLTWAGLIFNLNWSWTKVKASKWMCWFAIVIKLLVKRLTKAGSLLLSFGSNPWTLAFCYYLQI